MLADVKEDAEPSHLTLKLTEALDPHSPWVPKQLHSCKSVRATNGNENGSLPTEKHRSEYVCRAGGGEWRWGRNDGWGRTNGERRRACSLQERVCRSHGSQTAEEGTRQPTDPLDSCEGGGSAT